MQCLNLVLLLAAVSSASACKYFCRTPGTFQYECCDDGNPYFNPEQSPETSTSDASPVETDNCDYWCLKPNTSEYVCCNDGNPFLDEVKSEIAEATEDNETVPQPPSNCFYYCAYDGEVYCCGDSSRPIPESHDMHEGRCPEEEEQVCKSTGIFLNSKKIKAKTSGALRLVSGAGKEQETCASDGYCTAEQKCCPSKCARKHICLKALDEEEELQARKIKRENKIMQEMEV